MFKSCPWSKPLPWAGFILEYGAAELFKPCPWSKPLPWAGSILQDRTTEFYKSRPWSKPLPWAGSILQDRTTDFYKSHHLSKPFPWRGGAKCAALRGAAGAALFQTRVATVPPSLAIRYAWPTVTHGGGDSAAGPHEMESFFLCDVAHLWKTHCLAETQWSTQTAGGVRHAVLDGNSEICSKN